MTGDNAAEILVVDDEPDIVSLFETWLTERWVVRTATDGRSALEQVTPSTDLILLDRRMGEISGDEVLEQVRADGHDCRVVFVSAAEPDERVEALSFDDYLVKPVTRSELIGVIDELLPHEPPRDGQSSVA